MGDAAVKFGCADFCEPLQYGAAPAHGRVARLWCFVSRGPVIEVGFGPSKSVDDALARWP